MDEVATDSNGLLQLLEEWEFAYMLEAFEAEGITLKRLRFMTELDLSNIFKNHKIGEKAEFRHCLTVWRKEKGYETPQTCENIVLSAETEEIDFNQSPTQSQQELLSPQKSFDFERILSSHPTGEYVHRIFREFNKLNDASRKILIEAIVTWSVKNKIKLTKSTFDKIANDIQTKFNDDKEIYYSNTAIRPTGRLYDKYYNTLKRFRKTGEFGLKSTPPVELLPQQKPDICEDENEIIKAKEWLKVFCEPWNDVQENWRTCFKIRREDILHSEGSGIVEILRKWALFSHSLGYNLIDIDYKYLHPNSPTIIEKWNSFREKIVPILNEKVKDPPNLPFLEDINKNKKGSDTLIALLLHVLLRPNLKRKSLGDKKFNRSTIRDSQLSFLLHVISINDVQNRLEQMKTALFQRSETLQPLIIAVGEVVSNAKFYVYFDEIKYDLPSFLSSFDTCFKIFHALNLQYPVDSLEFWIFVQRYFYSITSTADKASPNVLCLINDLK